MGLAASVDAFDSPLTALRRMRRTQAWTLSVVAAVSVILGVALIRHDGADAAAVFQQAVGWQFVIWGAIDLIFGGMGIVQSARAAARPIDVQAEADEFAAAEKLLRTLRFNHKLNIGYVVVAVALLAAAGFAQSPSLAGHGVGVLLQGGFLLAFDLAYIFKFSRLMGTPV